MRDTTYIRCDTRVKGLYIGSATDLSQRALGEALSRKRREAGMGQQEAADSVGVSRVTLSRYENGKQRAPHDVVQRLVAHYDKAIAATKTGTGRIGNVSRGTVSEPTPARYERDLQWLEVEQADAPAVVRARYERLIAFERRLIRDGATDAEANYIRARGLSFLGSMKPENYLGDGDEDDKWIGEAMLDVEFDSYLEHVVGPIVMERIEARSIDPISPEDLPAEVARRRAELEAERPKRQAKA